MPLMCRIVLMCVSFALIFVGCQADSVSIELSAQNYTDRHISGFSVDGYGGGNVYANSGGGSFVCCINIPRRWHKGLAVTVQWSDDERNPEARKQRVVEVPEYGENDFGFLVVHFYDDDAVKVLVTTKVEGHPDYPYPRPSRRQASHQRRSID